MVQEREKEDRQECEVKQHTNSIRFQAENQLQPHPAGKYCNVNPLSQFAATLCKEVAFIPFISQPLANPPPP